MNDVKLSSFITLKSLLQSGAQEASEEQGVSSFLSPERVLSDVHHYKTGVLFQSPWAVPTLLEAVEASQRDMLLTALYNIGIGCQILDDMVDVKSDICLRKNNYAASAIIHATPGVDLQQLLDKALQGNPADTTFLSEFPVAQKIACQSALQYLNNGFDDLLLQEHSRAKEFAITFIANQIGAAPYLTPFT